MGIDILFLRQKIREARLTQEDIAKQISVDKSTFSRKMQNRGESFTIGEMHKIVEVLKLSHEDATKIFLA